MKRQATRLFANKLTDALSAADDIALAEVRGLWKGIGPASTCPNVGDLMRNIQHALARGYLSRHNAVIDLAAKTATSYPSLLCSSFTSELMSVVEHLFQKDHLVDSARNTLGVYQRMQAPGNKFDQRVFEIELGLIQASAANNASRTISRVRTLLEDECLKQAVSRDQAKLFPKEKIVSQTNNYLQGATVGQFNVAGESIYNTALNLSIDQIVTKIEASAATPAEKEEAKSLLTKFLAHPLVGAIVGGVAGGLVG